MPRRGLSVFHLLMLWAVLLVVGCDEAGDTTRNEDNNVAAAEGNNAAPAVSPLDQRWQTHLASLPTGTISARAPLIVRFNHPVASPDQLDKPQSGVVRLLPERPVTAVFTAEDRLEIRPLEPLPSGESLTLVLYAQGLANVDDTLSPAEFSLQVLRQQLSLSVESLLPTEDGREMVLRGSLETRDLADHDKVESVLAASQNGDGLTIVWQHDSAGLRHAFSVSGIVRKPQASDVLLRWDAAPLGLSNNGERHYTVPALKNFAVTNVRAVSYPQPHIQVNFSEALSATQNLKGLVTLNDNNARVEVDGSTLRIYPQEELDDDVALVIDASLRSASQGRLAKTLEKNLTLVTNKPGVRFVGEGTILPDGKQLSVPFEAVGVRSVKVQAFRVFDDNIGRYLQGSELNEADMDSRTGRYLWQKTLSLPGTGDGWQRYQLGLTELMAKHPNGLVHLTLAIDGDDISYHCPDGALNKKTTLPDNYEGPGQDDGGNDLYENYYIDGGYLSWYEKDNPCSDSYYEYNDLASSTRAFLASNLGLIAKQGQNDTLLVVATELDSNTPAEDVVLKAYNYQLQQVGMGLTDAQGMASLTLEGNAYYLEAVKDRDNGYLKLARNRALPTNQFNTGGQQVRDGLKGFFYGERDVWRPGDAIHLTFILEDQDNMIPEGHPLTLDWFDPRGNKVKSYTLDTPVGDFYAFTLHTDEDAPTGNWRAVARLGERYFDTPIRVEAIKPNRLKIELDLPETLYANEATDIGLFTQWLNGATAANLEADMQVRVSARTTRFDGYDAYHFDDPTRKLSSEPFTAFEGNVDGQGNATVPLTVNVDQTPGMLRATLTTRVFENSGDYSTQIRSVPVYPFKHWVGMRIPQGSGWGGALSREGQHAIDLISLNSDGKAEPSRPLDISVYQIDWRWWWDRSGDDLSNYISDPSTQRVAQAQITTDGQGRAQWNLNGEDYDWGRHLIRICDRQSDHCTAQTVYLGWSWEQASGSQDAATRLSLSADQDRYAVGDIAHIELPAVAKGRLLVSLETGSRVLDHYWLEANGKAQTLDIPVTANMAPNVYVHVALLQPHSGRSNDRPIRLYGLVPLLVDDPNTRLNPQLSAPQKVKPEETFTVEVSEQQGKPMTYTLALVDEGLLGLTHYQTPNPHDSFYRREALGVLTWDLFDMVVGAYGAELDQLLALGGSDGADDGREKQRRRFPPVVKFLGPFPLDSHETAHHDITLPPYMGQVRAMVVAGDNGAYGKAEQDITVTQPLTVLSTLPRVLGPGESVALPVTVFVTDDSLKNVNLTVEADNDLFEVEQGEASLTFTGPSDQIAMLKITAKQQVGIGDITVTAKGGEHSTSETVHLPVRAANPPTTRDIRKVLAPGELWALESQPHGMAGTNSSTVVVSALPAMGLERRLDYLLRYPHGCIEQTTSAVLPQLYLNQLLQLDEQQAQDVQDNVAAGIERLQRLQLADGGFSYWPGLANASDWGTSYAGHFLLEAKRLGYAVPAAMLDNWTAYQIRRSQSLGDRPWQWSAEAYRQYTLALAGKPQVGVMNRLRERLQMARADYARSASYHSGRWLLAAAYLQMGLSDVAAELTATAASGLEYDGASYTYGSQLRDQAIRLTVADARGDSAKAWTLAEDIASQLASDNWYSTQTTAWSLMAMARYAGSQSDEQGYRFAIREGKQAWQEIAATSPVYRQTLADSQHAQAFTVRNDSQRKLFATLSNVGTPLPGNEQASSEGLTLSTRFFADGQAVSPQKLPQGQDFVAEVTITNTGNRTLENLALTQILPSGWQITSSRLDGSDEQQERITYQDLRDDRVMHYFDLKPGSKHRLTVRVALNASFAGRFYLPAWNVQAMYDGSRQARSKGLWVEVTRE
ncbi:alpha-2-macroglobulin family N-terminal region [Alcanivorax sp. NBRC 101098]|uniref:alpha-2-macroglobulin family protein n=1 Tax=Alcanivorax sp. NBRC 101098 TaxID=1113728 RepID=UPI0004ABE1A4|nr:MG2 domain-containing protein [Alcanivorax sp. NBRC 101098]BAP13809.1 alpha-2-macroglobulin family N-terminal region [Alcanivorax sp. NBRC 101098]